MSELKLADKIKIVDLAKHYNSIKSEIDEAVNEVLKSGFYILGPNVNLFEKELATYLNTKHVISCANGTDALVLALMALDIKEGDEVITPSHSFFATSEAVALVGAKPVFVDVRADDFNIDPAKIEKAITKSTKAILPVHIYGQSCEIEEIAKIAKKNNLYLVEDCAQAIGAKYNKKNVGTFGEFGTLSFFPTKNLGAFGDGGAVITDNDELADKVRKLRFHGSNKRYIHDHIGLNSRLDEIQAAILRVSLRHLNDWTEKRIKAAERYTKLFAGFDKVITPNTKPNCRHVFHQFTLKVEKRDLLLEKLQASNIEAIIYYPVPIHMQKAFDYLNVKGQSLPVTEKISKEIISLPMYPEIDEETQKYVVDAVKKILS